MKKVVLLIVLTFVFVSMAFAQDIKGEFAKANGAYRNAKYDEAILGYESLLSQGIESGAIYYNLGNSYFKAGKIGKAVLNYERGRRVLARDGDLQANERFTSLANSSDQELGTNYWDKAVSRFCRLLTINEFVAILTLLGILIALIQIMSLYGHWPIKWVARVIVVAGLLFIVFAFGLWVKYDQDRDQSVVLKNVAARFEPNDKATVYFDLSEGQRVRILEREGDWQKIERNDKKLGWIPKDSVEQI